MAHPRLLRIKKSGRLLPLGDIDALYVTLDQLLSNRETLREYSAHAQQVAARYSFENVRAVWEDFLRAEKLFQG